MTKDTTMPKPDTGVHRRTGSTQWQWRIKVPTDLRHLYPTEWAQRCSLETEDLREANLRACQLRGEWLQKFDEQRKTLSAQPADQITPELGRTLAQRVAAAVLAGDEAMRSDPEKARTVMALGYAARSRALTALTIAGAAPPLPEWFKAPLDPLDGLGDELAAELAQQNKDMDAYAAKLQAQQRLSAVLGLVQSEALKLGLKVDPKTPGITETLREALKAYRAARQQVRMRDLGEVIETPAPAAPPKATAAPKGDKLRDVFDKWKVSKRRSEDAVSACERALSLYEQRTGNPPLQELTRAQGDDFRSWLQTLGGSSKTAHDRMTWVKSLLVYACRDLELLQRQPWEGLDIEYRTENPRRPWTLEELGAFFKLPLFSRYDLPGHALSGKDAAYWVPLLGLFSGARVGELCQLRIQDIETTGAGHFFRITDEGEGARVKSEAGHRRVPVHPELVRLGFMDYVKAVQDSGAVSLWPAMKFRTGRPGGYFSQWFNGFHRAATRNDKAPTFHALRHTVRTALHRAKVDTLAVDLIVGHESAGLTKVQRTYTHLDDGDLMRAIEALKFPSVCLRRVYGLATARVAA